MAARSDAASYDIVTKKTPTFFFVGVTTGQSSIMDVFPRWMAALDRDVVIEGIDHELRDDPAAYRQTVAQIKYDPLSLGGLVTSHKISLADAAGDMFDRLGRYAQITGEISCIAKKDTERGKALVGFAKDSITGGASLDAILGDDYFERTGGDVLCFGAGGSGVAISLHLMHKDNPADRPRRMVVVNRSQERLDKLERIVAAVGTDIRFEFIRNADPRHNDEIMVQLPAGSVVINATGLGKDAPGSPVTNQGLFPRDGVAWEINYRGDLDFWHQAMAQRQDRNLTVEDGWLYFLYGWKEHISEVLGINIDPGTFDRLAAIAEEVRPPLEFDPSRVTAAD